MAARLTTRAGLIARTRPAALALALVAAGFLAGCGVGAGRPPQASVAPTALASVPVAIDQTRLQVESALRAGGHFLGRPNFAYRPPESGALAAAPRVVYQVLMAEDPGHGLIVIYEFPDVARAALAGREMAAYIASGPGRIQFPLDARFVLRQLGTTLIFYTWSRESSPGKEVEEIAIVLETIGQGIAVPS